MPKRKPPPKRQPTDAERAAVEASLLLDLGRDLSRLSPAERLKVDLVSTLRLVLDNAGEVALEGGSTDIGKLVVAVEHLTRLLPAAREPTRSKCDEHERREAAIAPLVKLFRQLQEEVATLAAENAALKRSAAPPPSDTDVPTVVERVPVPAGNVVPLARPPASAAPAPASPTGIVCDDEPEPWRGYVGGRRYDPWADNRE
jgi:hypothetical protein